MKKFETEVLVYLNQVKSFLEKNEQARNYFIQGVTVDEFYEQVKIFSQQNLEKNGQPELSVEQFEEIRKPKVKKEPQTFIYTEFGGYSLN